MKVEDMNDWRMEGMMIRRMCGVHLKSRTANAELSSQLGIECITDVERLRRLWWFDHVERKDSERYQHLEVLKLMK